MSDKKIEKKTFKIKILDKWVKKVLWWERYYFSIEFLDPVMTPKYCDMPVESRANWTAFKIGDIALMPMYKADDGLWYPL